MALSAKECDDDATQSQYRNPVTVLHIGRIGHGLPGGSGSSEARACDEAAGSAIRDVCSDRRVHTRVTQNDIPCWGWLAAEAIVVIAD